MMRRRGLLVAAMTLVTGSAWWARADEIATLPLGDPARAYILGSGEAGQIVRCIGEGAPSPVSMDDWKKELASADVVIVGEHHTDIEGHRTQWRILESLAASGKAFALGMEFFELIDDEALASFVKGEDDVARMLEKTGWYTAGGYNFEYYRPMLETCRTHRAPVYGINIPREWVRTVSRQGASALTDEQRAAMGDVGPVDQRHKYVVNQMMGGIGAAMPQMFDGMYRGQTAWDAAMATSIVRAHKKHIAEGTPRTIVVIVGSGHMAHGLGIPSRLRELEPSLRVVTVAPVQGVKPDDDARLHPGFERKETAVFSLGYADYVYILPDSGNAEAYPQFGVRVGHPAGVTSGPVKVLSVTPGGIADRAGLKKDDVVLRIGDAPVASGAEAGFILGSLRWDERVVWRVNRPGTTPGELDVPMLVLPPTDGEGDWLKSEPASTIMDTFDPTSERSYKQPKDLKPAGAYARLVNFRKSPARIDLLRAGVLMEAWTLDDQGRPVLGLMAAPAPDGAVRVEITRDETGKATAVRRVGADGRPVEAGAADQSK